MNEKNKMGKGDQHVKCYMGRVLMKIFYLFFSRAYCLALFKHTRGILVSILDTLSTEIVETTFSNIHLYTPAFSYS